MKNFKRIMAIVLCLVLAIGCVPTAVFAEGELSEDIAILYTNDIHTYIDGNLSYDVIAAVKKDLQTKYKYVFLVDAGDHVQGTAYGSMDKGESIIKLMNAAGYDAATLGNHEFDYGMSRCLELVGMASYPYISCNFYKTSSGVRGENVLQSYVSFSCGTEKLAFVGLTTPDTFTKSTPAYFQDGNGNYIYGISDGENGADLFADVQNAIDSARAEGATKIIALGHIGVDLSSAPATSDAVIANVSGLDAFIDGHSHTVMKGETYTDKDGNPVVLTQTGQYCDRIGLMVIDSETGEIATDFILYSEVMDADGTTVLGYELTSGLYSGEFISDEAVKAVLDSWMGEIDSALGQTIGKTELVFNNYDENGNRLVRSGETNTGDFCADALYYLFDSMGMEVDVAIMNGGGIRNKAVTGDITYKVCKDIHTFGNVACLQTVTGQQILDALEWGSRGVGVGEVGAFLQVSGLTYKIDTSVPDTTQKDELELWTGAPEKYRVYDVKVFNRETGLWEDLDLNRKYNLAGYNYTLRDLGDGYTMFSDAVNVLDYVMEDYMVLANYVLAYENGEIKADNSPLKEKYPNLVLDYGELQGSGRIEIGTRENEVPPTGYNGNIAIWAVVFVLSGTAAAAVFSASRKRT